MNFKTEENSIFHQTQRHSYQLPIAHPRKRVLVNIFPIIPLISFQLEKVEMVKIGVMEIV